MKIGIDARCLLSGKKSGVEEYTYQIIKNVLKQDKKNQYILFLNSGKKKPLNWKWIDDFSNVKIKFFRWPNRLLNFLFWYFRFPFIDKMLGGIDVFWAPNLNFWGLSKSVKFVLTLHDLSFEYYPETFHWKRRLWRFFINPRSSVCKADKIIVVSQSTKDDLVNFYKVPSQKIKVIPSGIDTKYKVLDRNDFQLIKIKEKYQIPFNFIFFLGTIEPRKNIESIIKAYELLRQEKNSELDKYKLVIAGNSGWKAKKIFKTIQNSVYKRDIFFIGEVDEKDKIYLYNLASLFIFPSFLEGFGFPPLEAMSCGTPVITSFNTSFPETVGDAVIMVDPNKEQEIKEAMQMILLNKKLQKKLIQKGLQQVQKFNWEISAREHKKVWTSI